MARRRSPGLRPPRQAGRRGITSSATTPREESTHSTPVTGATWLTWAWKQYAPHASRRTDTATASARLIPGTSLSRRPRSETDVHAAGQARPGAVRSRRTLGPLGRGAIEQSLVGHQHLEARVGEVAQPRQILGHDQIDPAVLEIARSATRVGPRLSLDPAVIDLHRRLGRAVHRLQARLVVAHFAERQDLDRGLLQGRRETPFHAADAPRQAPFEVPEAPLQLEEELVPAGRAVGQKEQRVP